MCQIRKLSTVLPLLKGYELYCLYTKSISPENNMQWIAKPTDRGIGHAAVKTRPATLWPTLESAAFGIKDCECASWGGSKYGCTKCEGSQIAPDGSQWAINTETSYIVSAVVKGGEMAVVHHSRLGRRAYAELTVFDVSGLAKGSPEWLRMAAIYRAAKVRQTID